MTFAIDPELGTALTELLGDDPPPPPAVGDWASIRGAVADTYARLASEKPRRPNIGRSWHQIDVGDGRAVAARWYAPPEPGSGSAIVHAHGGGMIAGSVDTFDRYIAEYVELSGVPFLSVDYGLAPQVSGQGPVRDVFAGLTWLRDHAADLGVDPERIGLMGESAGGGLVAGTAILARDQRIPVAHQILIYPMIDDTTIDTQTQLEPFATWSPANNETGWRSLLGDAFGTEHIAPEVAPARVTDASRLPPTYLEVGELDIFRDENVRFASKLWAAGVSVELHVRAGQVHGFDHFAPSSETTSRAMSDRVRIVRGI